MEDAGGLNVRHQLFRSAAEFVSAVRPILDVHEVEHHLVLGRWRRERVGARP